MNAISYSTIRSNKIRSSTPDSKGSAVSVPGAHFARRRASPKAGCHLVHLLRPVPSKEPRSDLYPPDCGQANLLYYLPVTLTALHVCHPTPLFAVLVKVVRFVAGDVLRVQSHSGSYDDVIVLLETKFGHYRSSIPTDMGGELELDIHGWLAERRAAGVQSKGFERKISSPSRSIGK